MALTGNCLLYEQITHHHLLEDLRHFSVQIMGVKSLHIKSIFCDPHAFNFSPLFTLRQVIT